MTQRTNLQYVDHPAPFVEHKPNGVGLSTQSHSLSRLDKTASVYSIYNVLSEKEQRACNMATD